MKKMLPVGFALVSMLLLSIVAVSDVSAVDQCDVLGQTYTVTLDGGVWTLTDFENTIMFSPAPRCGGTVTLVDSDGVSYGCDWSVAGDSLVISDAPARLTDDGLMIYLVPQGLHTLCVGGMVYKTEQVVQALTLK